MSRSILKFMPLYERPCEGDGRESRRKGSFRSFIKVRARRLCRRNLKADLMSRMTEDEADLWDPYQEMEYDPDGYWDDLYRDRFDDPWDSDPYDLGPLCDPNEWEDDSWEDDYEVFDGFVHRQIDTSLSVAVKRLESEYPYDCQCGERYSNVDAAKRCRKCVSYLGHTCQRVTHVTRGVVWTAVADSPTFW